MKKIVMIVLFFCLIGFGGATNYYVSSFSGNDSWSGKLPIPNVAKTDGPWKTISKVNDFVFQIGDDVYFKCGDVWRQQQLKVDWNGTARNRAVVGAYYGNGEIGVNENGRPIFDYGYDHDRSDCWNQPDYDSAVISISPPWTPGWDKLNGYDKHNGLADYVTIENLEVKDSKGYGVRFNYAFYGEAKNVKVSDIEAGAFLFWYSDYGTIDNCTGSGGGIAGHIRRIDCSNSSKVFRNWPMNMGGVYSKYVTVKNSLVYNTWTEAIGFYKEADYGLAENNLIYGAQKAGIYVDGSKNVTMRYNVIYGTTNSTYHRNNNMCGGALWTGDEGIVENRDSGIKIYGNLVAYCNVGIAFGDPADWGEHYNSSYHAYGMEAYDNTIVDCNEGMYLGTKHLSTTIRNNIVWNPSGGKLITKVGDYAGFTMDHNMWGGPVATGATGQGDIIGNPLLNKTSGWQNLTAGSLFSSDFKLNSTSPTINAGVNLSFEYSKDYFGNIRGADGKWDIGAVEYVSGKSPVCGNNLTELEEVCDGMDLNGRNCSSVNSNFVSGNLSCFSNCSGYDVSRCVVGGKTCSVKLSDINQKMIDWRDRKCVLGDVIALIRQWVAEGRC